MELAQFPVRNFELAFWHFVEKNSNYLQLEVNPPK